MTKQQINRIPAGDQTAFHTWAMPAIEEKGNVVPCAEKEDRDKKKNVEQRRKEVVGEVVDTENLDEPLTVEQLVKVAENARQEGYAEGFKQGYEEGNRKGHSDGLERGLSEGRHTTEILQGNLSSIINDLLDPYQTRTKQLELLVLDTVVNLTKSIVQRELLVDSGQIISFVQQALLALPASAEHIKIFLNPDDLVVMENYRNAHHLDWKLYSDTKLSPGGCRVETKQSLIDFSIEERLRVLCNRFIAGELSQHTKVPNEALSGSQNSEHNSSSSSTTGGELEQ